MTDIQELGLTRAERDPLGIALANWPGMSQSTRKMRQLLEAQYGIDRGFTGHLAPLLERFAASEPTAEESENFIRALVAAYRASKRGPAEPRNEVKVLLGDVAAELRKVEESLKVLGVYLLKIHQKMQGEPTGPTFH